MTPRSRRLSRAFTLLELILVMGILVIVAGMVAPRLRGFAAGRRTLFTATQIVTAAHYARSQSISEGRAFRLNFDPSARQFWLTADDGGGNFVAVAKDDFDQHFQVPDGVQLDTDVNQKEDGQYVTFLPSGRTEPAHIRLKDDFGGDVQVVCESATESFHILESSGS